MTYYDLIYIVGFAVGAAVFLGWISSRPKTMTKSELVDLTLQLHHETDRAILI